MASSNAIHSRHSRPLADAEQPELLRALRRCSLQGDYIRWESLRGKLCLLGYSVVLVRGVEHLRALSS